ncbi:tetratricopeptide repeat protein [Streptomyces sp. ms191]|uniref:tetratricopeptide repeat protein n=1 Tax=Streptomyces sp. ms191 TaxID=1827978 RepID=UPI0011CE7211|nr:tetratricopeptide repeat protein [Streptomyces sp. ms191]TXS22182.1 tetratricopeptide repeat protein [Streptomyces sp. ms191]
MTALVRADGNVLVDREEALAAFHRLCRDPRERLLFVYGMAGQGKTTLLSHLVDTIAPAHGLTGNLLDLEHLTDFEASTADGIAFAGRALDAVARCFEMHSGTVLKEYRRSRGIAADTVRNFLTSVPRLRLRQRASRNSSISNVSISWEGHSDGCRLALLRDNELSRMTEALLRGVVDHRGELPPGARHVLCIDTSERLHFLDGSAADRADGGNGVRHWLVSDVLANLLDAWPGLAVVLAGREPLTPPAGHRAKQVRLDAWREHHTHTYLSAHGITAPTAARSVHQLSGGLPLWANVLAEICATAGSPASDLVLPTSAYEPDPMWTSRVLLSRLPEKRRRVVAAASVLRRIERDALVALLDVVDPAHAALAGRAAHVLEAAGDQGGEPHADGLSGNWFEDLCSYSFVHSQRTPSGGFEHRMHPLVRGAILSYLEREQTGLLRILHKAATRHHHARGNWMDALFHALSTGEDTAMATWKEQLDLALSRYDFSTSLRLVELVVSDDAGPATADRAQLMVEAHIAAGRIAFFQMRLDDAEISYRRARDMADERGDRVGAATALLHLAELSHRRLDVPKADEAVNDALILFEREHHVRGRAESLHRLGHLRLARMDIAGASQAAADSLVLFRAQGDALGQARALELLGHIRLGQADLAGAKEHIKNSLTLYDREEDLRGLASTLGLVADISLLQGFVAEATEAADRARSIYRQTGDAFREAGAVHIFGRVRLAAGDLLGAESDARVELSVHERTGNQLGQANALHLLGTVHLAAGRTDEAVQAALGARTRYEEVGNPLGAAHAVQLLGRVALGKCHEADAEPLFTQALDQYRRVGNPLGEADALYWRAMCEERLGRPADAVADAEAAADIYARLGGNRGLGESASLAARLHLAASRSDRAELRLRQARKAFRLIGDTEHERTAGGC